MDFQVITMQNSAVGLSAVIPREGNESNNTHLNWNFSSIKQNGYIILRLGFFVI